MEVSPSAVEINRKATRKRLSGTTAKTFENDLKTFADFYARIDEVSTIVNAADKATINGRDESTISIGFGPGKSVDMSAAGYVNGYLMPNLFFHLTTVYNILRKEGVELGKLDYLKAVIRLSVERDDLGPALRTWLHEFVSELPAEGASSS